jgi:hypothetical protein
MPAITNAHVHGLPKSGIGLHKGCPLFIFSPTNQIISRHHSWPTLPISFSAGCQAFRAGDQYSLHPRQVSNLGCFEDLYTIRPDNAFFTKECVQGHSAEDKNQLCFMSDETVSKDLFRPTPPKNILNGHLFFDFSM